MANSTGDVNVTPSGCIDSIFRKLDVYQGSNLIEDIDEYGLLANVMLDCQVSPIDRAYQLSTTGTRRFSSTVKGLDLPKQSPVFGHGNHSG